MIGEVKNMKKEAKKEPQILDADPLGRPDVPKVPRQWEYGSERPER